MSKLLPKKLLDQEILDEIAKYYKIKVDDTSDLAQFLEWECFSHPSLELHECNNRTLLFGRHRCSSCNHVVGRPCNISCDFQTVCLAVFAWRLGIGGSDFKKALHNNLYKMTSKDLYEEVIKKFTGDEIIELAEEPIVVKEEPIVEKKVEIVNDPNEYVTIQEAAKILACSTATVYNYTSSGKIPHRKENRKLLIRKGDLSDIRVKTVTGKCK